MTAKQFEEMFPSLANAEAFTVGGRRFVSMDKVLEIIDKESRYISSKEAYRNAACQDYWRSITSIRRAIEELRGNNKQ